MTQSNFTFDPKEHVYTLDGKPMTGMTTILGVLGKPALIPWAAKMVCEYIRENAMVLSESVEQTYLATEAILKEAQVAHAKKKTDAATKGTDTHALVESYINHCIQNTNGFPAPIADNDGSNVIRPFQKWAIDNQVKFLASELQVYSRELWVAGTMDFLFEKDGKKYIGDLKTYKKIWDRVPMFQCAGYAYLYEEMNPNEKIAGYVVFNLPKEREHNPNEDVRWSFDTDGDTKAFLSCVELYRQLANWK